MRFFWLALLGAVWSLAWTDPALAHFLWLVAEPAERPTSVKLYFGEEAAPDDPDLLDHVARTQGWVAGGRRSEPKPLTWTKDAAGAAWVAEIPAGTSSPILANLNYGVIRRGGETFLLKYYAKANPSTLPGAWQAVGDDQRLPLEIVPTLEGSTAAIGVRWQGQAVKDAEVVVVGPGLKQEVQGTTDEKGVFRCPLADPGGYSVRARHVETTAGEHEGKSYRSIRHYTTLAMPYTPPQLAPVAHHWGKLPRGVTSFGGAVAGDWLYVYGGHYGEAHHYSREGQSGDFLRLNLTSASEWESLPGGPKLTGLAMVAHGGRLYRVGGFMAKNGENEPDNLWSQPDFASFHPQRGTWTSLPPLPAGRSSHDAAVVGNTLYVVGGWQLRGEGETQWHETALSMDLAAQPLTWKPIAPPPFKRRALALAAWQDKLYVLGGMQEEGGPTTRVAIYDPKSNSWSEGPNLLGTSMDGFGAAAFACHGRLVATTMSGAIQRLSADGSQWECVGQLEHPRFFHRVLAWQKELVIVGGAHMAVGKIEALERLPAAR
jgi:N-acetylneuraminic acid mutarotase